MACGRPIIACVNLNGDASKIIRKAECGYCIEPEDPEKLSQTVLNLYRNKALREKMGENGRKYAEKNFSRSECVQRYEEVLSKACKMQI